MQRGEITLLAGAHRTGAGALVAALRAAAPALAERGIAVWTPREARDGRLRGAVGDPGAASGDLGRAKGRLALRRAALAERGTPHLWIADPGLLGSPRESVLLAKPYPSAAARLSRLSEALGGVDRIGLAVRDLEGWWTSTLGARLARGADLPDAIHRDAIAASRRGWADVVQDVAGAVPGAAIRVWTHEGLGARPGAVIEALAEVDTGPNTPAPRTNETPSLAALQKALDNQGSGVVLPGVGGRLAPFDPDQRARMRALHRRDMEWLRAGAEGLATMLDAPARRREGGSDGRS